MTLNGVDIPSDYIVLPFQKYWQLAAIGADGLTRSFKIPFETKPDDIRLLLRTMAKALANAASKTRSLNASCRAQ